MTDAPSPDYAALRRLAEAVDDGLARLHPEDEINYRRAANPATILALLDRAEKAEAEVAKMTDPAYLTEAIKAVGMVDAEWQARAEKAEAEAREQTEALARWMIASSFATGHGNNVADLIGELDYQVKEMRSEAAALREALRDAANWIEIVASDSEAAESFRTSHQGSW